jgi:predicted  nucleic acid-binding Zn-ribbon protein
MDIQTEQLMKHSTAQTDRIIQELYLLQGGIKYLQDNVVGLREDVAGLREDVAGLREDVAGLREDMTDIRKELEQSRFWAKITGIGLWTVVAGIIANFIFEMLTKV